MKCKSKTRNNEQGLDSQLCSLNRQKATDLRKFSAKSAVRSNLKRAVQKCLPYGKTMAFGLLVELGPRTKNSMFYDAVKELLEEKTMVSNQKYAYSLQIQHLHCLPEKVVVDETRAA